MEMEGIRTEETPCVMAENNTAMSEGEPMMTKNKKIKNKKKKRGQNKKLGVKLQSKKGEPASLNTNKKWDGGKKNAEKRKEVAKPGGEENDAMQNQNNQQEKTAKKRRNHRDFAISSAKMELTASIHQETEGRTSHRDDRTLYVRFPQSLSVREKSYVQPMVPTAVDIRFPRLSPGNSAKFCYIEFETEEEASVMKDKIEKIEVNGEAFYVDYVGKKSKSFNEKEPRTIDPLRLYVGGLPKEIQYSDMKEIFPTASRIFYRKASHKISQSYAYIIYKTHEEALKVFNATRDLKILGKEVIVIFATYKSGSAVNEDEDQSIAHLSKKLKTEAM